LGFKTRLFSKAFVYHKRRIDWEKFQVQVTKFGKARPILNAWHPAFAKPTYYFPTLFILGFYLSWFLLLFAQDYLLKCYFSYFLLVFIIASYQNKSLYIGYLAAIAVWKQFQGYGHGFLESFVKVQLLKQKPEQAFPSLFFNQ
jgi:hypothetical protein